MIAFARSLLGLLALTFFIRASDVWATDRIPEDAKAVVANTLAKAYGEPIKIDNPDLIDGFGGGSPGEGFGAMVALDGDTLAVAAPALYSIWPVRGAIFMFQRNNSEWELVERIDVADMGRNIALSGDRLAYIEIESWAGFEYAGHVGMFNRVNGQWHFQTKITPSPDSSGDGQVVHAIALSGDTLAMGLGYADVAGTTNEGVVDIYSGSTGGWARQVRLNPAGSNEDAQFGTSVALKDGLLVAGAPGGIGSSKDRGSAVVFELQGATWSQRIVINPTDPQVWAEFGAQVAADREQILVGAPRADVSGLTDKGAAYVFEANGGSWIQRAKLTAADGRANAQFGRALAIDGDLALIESYAFQRSGLAWNLKQKLSTDVTSVALQAGETVVSNGLFSEQRGRALVFSPPGAGPYVLSQTLALGIGGAAGDWFGTSVDIDGDVAVVGAYRDSLVTGNDHGSVTVLRRDANGWQVEAKLVAADGMSSDYFGHAVAISGNTIVAGALNKTINGVQSAGAVYVFVRLGNQWVQQARLSVAGSVYLGTTVALDGETLIVGSPSEAGPNGNSGAVHVFKRNTSAWTHVARLVPSSGAYSSFGDRIALDGQNVLVRVGSYGSLGEVLHLQFNGTSWVQRARIRAPDGLNDDDFGSSLDMDGSLAVIGAKRKMNGTTSFEGAAYVFESVANGWAFRSKLRPPAGTGVVGFGSSIALRGQHLIVGASGSLLAFEQVGSEWLYQRLFGSNNSFDSLGATVAMDERHWIAGQEGADYLDAGYDAGAVYISANRHLVQTQVAGSGVVEPNDPNVLDGDAATLHFTPDPGQALVFAEGCGGTLIGSEFTTAPVTAPCVVTFTTAFQQFNLSYLAGPNGSVSGELSQVVTYLGSGVSVTAVPASGYHFQRWSDGSTANPRIDSEVTASLQVTAHFANDAPLVSALSATPSTLHEYESAVMSAVASDLESATLQYAFDCDGNGSFEVGPQASAQAQCLWTSPGQYLGKVRVTDGPGAATVRSVTVNVSDSRPSVSASAAATAIEGEAHAIVVSATLPSSGEAIVAYEVDCDAASGGFDVDVAQATPVGLACTFVRGGSHQVLVRARDDEFEYGVANPLLVDVAPVNDPPEFRTGRERHVPPNSGAALFVDWITDIRPGPAAATDEIGQQVVLELTGNSNPALFAVQPSLANDGSLGFTPAADITGSAVLTYRACDDGPTASPHQHCSAPVSTTIGISTGTDLEIAIDNHRVGVLDDEDVVYAVVVANAGPNAVAAASVNSNLSSALLDPSWVCVPAQSTAACPSPIGNAGELAATVDLAVGQYLRFDLIARVDADVGASVASTVSVNTPMGMTSLVAANDSATDDDPVVPIVIFQGDFESPIVSVLATPGAAEALR